MARKPTLRKGPASSHEGPAEIIREFGDGKGNGGLLAITKMDDGALRLDVYAMSGPVVVNVSKERLP